MEETVLRAALYIRVSSAEQAMHGYSLEAQKEFLEAYAKDKKMRVVGIYADEGKSASKRLYQRKALLKMVEDMEAGLIDVILFKDITRWSRNSSHYHKIQDRIDAAGGYWIAVQQEHLETKTPTGRFQVTVMLGTAQLEAEQTSERIKFVNASRIPKGGVPWGGNSCPLGYTVADIDGMKRVVKDPEQEEMTRDFFDCFLTYASLRKALMLVSEKYGHVLFDKSGRKMLYNTMYKGEYKGVKGYCEPYLTEEEFDKIQKIMANRNYTPNDPKRVYVFSSLVRCKECGRNLSAYHTGYQPTNTVYLYYRCKNYTMYRTCNHSRGMGEKKLEKWLLKNIEQEMNKYIQEVKIEQADPPDTEKIRKKIESKLKNTRELYIDGDIDKQEYTRRKEEFEAQLAEIPTFEVKDTSALEEFLNSDWRTLYESLGQAEKRSFWRGIIEYIEVDNDLNITPHFFD